MQIDSDSDAVLERLSRAAEVFISGLAARDADYVPERMRPAITEMSIRLRSVVSALFDVQAAYEDGCVLEAMLRAAPLPCDVDAHQQLRFLHGHLSYAQATFAAAAMRLQSRFNAAIEIASLDEEPVDLAPIAARAGIDWIGAHAADTSEQVSSDQIAAEPMKIASRWSADLPAFDQVHDQLRSALLAQVQRCCAGMKIVAQQLVQACGPALLAQVERHNVMIRNFEIKGPSAG